MAHDILLIGLVVYGLKLVENHIYSLLISMRK